MTAALLPGFTEQNSTKFCDMLGSEPHLQNAREKLEEFPRLKIEELKTAHSGTVWNSTRTSYAISRNNRTGIFTHLL